MGIQTMNLAAATSYSLRPTFQFWTCKWILNLADAAACGCQGYELRYPKFTQPAEAAMGSGSCSSGVECLGFSGPRPASINRHNNCNLQRDPNDKRKVRKRRRHSRSNLEDSSPDRQSASQEGS